MGTSCLSPGFLRGGWSVQFLEQDCRTPLPRKFNFKDAEKIWEIVRRGEALGTQYARKELEREIENGRVAFICT
jgi:hypothetical protein